MTPGERLALAKVELDGNLSAVVKANKSTRTWYIMTKAT
jgi:hypothetical protein